ncbi:hypothetical protein CBOM_04602 [Ceraceosorus bombacis]|uniref:Uncharacterized protein n=1 Tax=Ceraceosorus bombacis TaxID=401625 RepID=A0A0N7LB23_9BASI|nr:hypothetical protein CBOM_04602 [Ceraceosorus bombacis]
MSRCALLEPVQICAILYGLLERVQIRAILYGLLERTPRLALEAPFATPSY